MANPDIIVVGAGHNGLVTAAYLAKAAPGNFAARTAYGRSLVDNGDTARGVKELEAAMRLARAVVPS